MPLQETSGAATYDAFGGGVPVIPAYIEEVFSTWLYNGNASTQTITNGIDLSTKGGLVWIKNRPNAGYDHALFDTSRGVNKQLKSNSTAAEVTYSGSLTAFTSSGFSLGADTAGGYVNDSLTSHVSWTFREQPKFFDVVTYTGNGTAGRTVSHNLGSAPGVIIVKRTDGATNWRVYHRSLGATQYLDLDETNAAASATTIWNDTAPTSTVFSVGTNSGVNASGGTYVAYVFAHDAGGFGLTGTDNVISCGSFTHTTGSTQSINLGYEPQFALLKRTSGADNWFLMDTMRGWTVNNSVNLLNPNLADAENNSSDYLIPTATGFDVRPGLGPDGATYIYIAIRRGPMKTPTSGTSVFSPNTFNATTGTVVTTNFPIDWQITGDRNNVADKRNYSRLTGVASPGTTAGRYMSTNTSDAEAATGSLTNGWDNTGFRVPSSYASTPFVGWNFRRAPGFFDQVCYAGNSTAGTVLNHNLGVVPELIITKVRNYGFEDWVVSYNSGSSITAGYLNNTTAFAGSGTAPSTDLSSFTATTYTLNTSNRRVNAAYNYIAYLFATCPGVSKVGSYTGTGATQTIDCGFTGGARFVLIKRTNSTGNWWVWDTARGMVAGTDPRLLLNNTDAETNANWVYTATTGFQIVTTDASVNASGGTYIFLAIA